MKTRQLIHHSALFVVAFAAFGLSIISIINLSEAEMNNHLFATWAMIQILISVAGFIVLPIFMLSSFFRIIWIALQPPQKEPYIKRKRTPQDTIAS